MADELTDLHARLQTILVDDPGEVVRIDFARPKLILLVKSLGHLITQDDTADNSDTPDVLRRLTFEEAAKVEPLTDEVINNALEKGRKAASK